MYPTDRRYSEEHEWILVDGDQATLGITEFAQSELGDIVFVDLPEVGREFRKGDVLGTIESVKTVGEIFAPVSGTVVEVNDTLTERPEVTNQDPHGEGWYCKVKLSLAAEVDELMDAARYEAHAGS
jgi:glycine cleavage system H protein